MDFTPYEPKAIANHFLTLVKKRDHVLTPMKLQKLCYYAYGWNLAIADQRLFSEQIEAWSFGPVIRSLYHEFKQYGDQPITQPATAMRIVGPPGPIRWEDYVPSINDIPDEAEYANGLLEKIWDAYGNYSAVQLSNMTHASDTPWDVVNKKFAGKIPKSVPIPDSLIKRYFAEKLL